MLPTTSGRPSAAARSDLEELGPGRRRTHRGQPRERQQRAAVGVGEPHRALDLGQHGHPVGLRSPCRRRRPRSPTGSTPAAAVQPRLRRVPVGAHRSHAPRRRRRRSHDDERPRPTAHQRRAGATSSASSSGRGGMAEVRKGTDVRLGRMVAIKRLRTDLASDPTFQARFRREAQLGGLEPPRHRVGLRHRRGALHRRRRRAQPYIVMEYVAGRTLRDVLRRGPQDPARAGP